MLMALSAPGRVSADSGDAPLKPRALAKLPFDALFDVEVTSVTKKPEKLTETASAIQVLTAEDIRRSGATQLADVLRLAANVEVQQINSFAWVVSTRGFDAVFANKLLVMIDGRTVYNPLDAGVFWDAQGVLLEDIDRIEIISGPGGTLWGSNAVNGVINIITKSARETQGAYVSGGGGSFTKDFGAARFGGAIGRNAFYRFYAQRFDRKSTWLANGNDGRNAWYRNQTGFRVDSYPSEASAWTLQGDAYQGREYNSPNGSSTLDGQDLEGHWRRRLAETSELNVQLYVDRTWRVDFPSTVRDQVVTYDLSLQHSLAAGERHSVLWGAGYRLMRDDTPHTNAIVGFVPASRTMELFSAFLQDEVSLVPARWRLTVGTKLENLAYGGWVVQPSARMAWTPSERHTLWAAVSRALRAPSRIDVDYRIPVNPPYLIAGGPDFHSEKLHAYEAGYRAKPLRTLSVSLAGFYNNYDDLYSVEPQSPPALFPYTIQNGAAGQSYGVELSGMYRPVEWWRVRAGYTWNRKNLWSRPGHNVLNSVLASLGNDPRNQAAVQSMLDLGGGLQADVTARYVDQLPRPSVPNYIAVDGRLAWSRRHWEASVTGQNLTDHAHPEFYTVQEIPRSVYGQLTTRW
jgi:iron complex outermembrane receptor protein